MNPGWKEKLLGYAQRQHLRGLALAVFWVTLGIALWSAIVFELRDVGPMPVPDTNVIPEDVATTTEDVLRAPASEPRTLRIPSLNISAPFEPPLGLSNDGSIGVPDGYDTVGWYKYGPTPGEMGPAIVLGHVDSYEGPGVFFYLGQLDVGDTVEIERNDGSVAVFKVTGYERVEQSAFPTDRVYSDLPYAGLRLITCSGTYDKKSQRYDHNLIVYGELSEVRYPEKSTE